VYCIFLWLIAKCWLYGPASLDIDSVRFSAQPAAVVADVAVVTAVVVASMPSLADNQPGSSSMGTVGAGRMAVAAAAIAAAAAAAPNAKIRSAAFSDLDPYFAIFLLLLLLLLLKLVSICIHVGRRSAMSVLSHIGRPLECRSCSCSCPSRQQLLVATK